MIDRLAARGLVRREGGRIIITEDGDRHTDELIAQLKRNAIA